MTLTLDDMTLLVLREGRKEGKKAPSVWLPFEVWLGAVTRLLPDAQREKMTGETRPFWEALWNRNRSPIEAIMSPIWSRPPAERMPGANEAWQREKDEEGASLKRVVELSRRTFEAPLPGDERRRLLATHMAVMGGIDERSFDEAVQKAAPSQDDLAKLASSPLRDGDHPV